MSFGVFGHSAIVHELLPKTQIRKLRGCIEKIAIFA